MRYNERGKPDEIKKTHKRMKDRKGKGKRKG